MEDKFPEFIRIYRKDITLKFLFDNIRNIGLSVFVFVIGVMVIDKPPLTTVISSIPYANIALGLFLILSGLLLYLANCLQGVLAIQLYFGKKYNKKIERVLFIIIFFCVYFPVSEIFFRQVFNLLEM